jgi:hypothetical protein
MLFTIGSNRQTLAAKSVQRSAYHRSQGVCKIEVPGLGEVTKDERSEWYYSSPVKIPVLGGKEC